MSTTAERRRKAGLCIAGCGSPAGDTQMCRACQDRYNEKKRAKRRAPARPISWASEETSARWDIDREAPPRRMTAADREALETFNARRAAGKCQGCDARVTEVFCRACVDGMNEEYRRKKAAQPKAAAKKPRGPDLGPLSGYTYE